MSRKFCRYLQIGLSQYEICFGYAQLLPLNGDFIPILVGGAIVFWAKWFNIEMEINHKHILKNNLNCQTNVSSWPDSYMPGSNSSNSPTVYPTVYPTELNLVANSMVE